MNLTAMAMWGEAGELVLWLAAGSSEWHILGVQFQKMVTIGIFSQRMDINPYPYIWGLVF